MTDVIENNFIKFLRQIDLEAFRASGASPTDVLEHMVVDVFMAPQLLNAHPEASYALIDFLDGNVDRALQLVAGALGYI